MPKAENKKNEYAKMVCLFLAEGLRSRRISLHRSADIAEKVIANINLIDTEHDFLRLIKELSKDFDELLKLEERIFMHIKVSDRIKFEKAVKEFAISVMSNDSKLALEIMQTAIKTEMDLKKFTERYPEFKKFSEDE